MLLGGQVDLHSASEQRRRVASMIYPTVAGSSALFLGSGLGASSTSSIVRNT